MATNIRLWRKLERHPESARYKDIKGDKFKATVADMRENGFDKSRPIILAPDDEDGGKIKVGDGWQRQRAAVEADVRPVYVMVPKGMTLKQAIARYNDNRRHESREDEIERIEKRIEEVARKKAAGMSNRAIAEEVGVSEGTVRGDLDDAAAKGIDTEPPNGTVSGRDGKKHPVPAPSGEERVCDSSGKVVPQRLVKVFKLRKLIRQAGLAISKAAARCIEVENAPSWGNCKPADETFEKFGKVLKRAAKAYVDNCPSLVCPSCEGDGGPCCQDRGFFSMAQTKEAPLE